MALKRLAEGQDILLADHLADADNNTASSLSGPNRLAILLQIQYNHNPPALTYTEFCNENSHNNTSINQEAGSMSVCVLESLTQLLVFLNLPRWGD
jgi:hypothetical protein